MQLFSRDIACRGFVSHCCIRFIGIKRRVYAYKHACINTQVKVFTIELRDSKIHGAHPSSTHTHTHIAHIYQCMHICMCMHIHKRKNLPKSASMATDTHAYIYIPIHMHTYTYRYTCMHIHNTDPHQRALQRWSKAGKVKGMRIRAFQNQWTGHQGLELQRQADARHEPGWRRKLSVNQGVSFMLHECLRVQKHYLCCMCVVFTCAKASFMLHVLCQCYDRFTHIKPIWLQYSLLGCLLRSYSHDYACY